jgi:hypothetical protein
LHDTGNRRGEDFLSSFSSNISTRSAQAAGYPFYPLVHNFGRSTLSYQNLDHNFESTIFPKDILMLASPPQLLEPQYIFETDLNGLLSYL